MSFHLPARTVMPTEPNSLTRLAARLRARRHGNAPVAVESDAPDDGIEFTPVSPVYASDALPDFALMSEAWVRRHCAPQTFADAVLIVSRGRFEVQNRSAVTLSGRVRGASDTPRSVELRLADGRMDADCNCGRVVPALPGTPDGPLLCRHAAALLLACLPPASVSPDAPAQVVCPVTRLPIEPGALVYQCRRCRTAFRREGWEFLRDLDRGRCCNCGERGGIGPVTPR